MQAGIPLLDDYANLKTYICVALEANSRYAAIHCSYWAYWEGGPCIKNFLCAAQVHLVVRDSLGFGTFRPDVCFESSALRGPSAGKSYSSISWLKRVENALLSAFG